MWRMEKRWRIRHRLWYYFKFEMIDIERDLYIQIFKKGKKTTERAKI